MKKRFIVILGCILILIMSGLNNTRKDKDNDNEPYKEVSTLKNMLDETINNKYIFKEFEDRVYKNKKYLYDVNDSLICYFDGDNTSIFLSTKGEHKNLKLIKEKYDYFSMGLSYVFKDESDERYRLYITKIDDEDLYFKWVYPDQSYEEFTTELLNKNECENRIKTRMNEVEIDNLLESDFKDSSGLDIDKIKDGINKAREVIYSATKENKSSNYYFYIRGYACGKEDSDFEYYIFNLVNFDDTGNVFNKSEDYILVKSEDYSIYIYSLDAPGKGKIQKLNINN